MWAIKDLWDTACLLVKDEECERILDLYDSLLAVVDWNKTSSVPLRDVEKIFEKVGLSAV